MKTVFLAALHFYLLQQKGMREPVRASYSPSHSSYKSIRMSQEVGSHTEEKEIIEAPKNNI